MMMLEACQAPDTGLGDGKYGKYYEDLDDLSTVMNSCMNPDIFADEDLDAFSPTFDDDEAAEGLLGLSSYVMELPGSAVEAEPVFGPRTDDEFMASAMPPCELEVLLPPTWTPGSLIKMDGPVGAFTVRLQGQPGVMNKVRIAPRPDYRIEVPPGSVPGSDIRFRRHDGTMVAVSVPEGAAPGDFFEVMPPALMVQVPKGASAGSLIRFRLCGNEVKAPWELEAGAEGGEERMIPYCRAVVPEGVHFGDYFAVRIPAA